MLLVFKKGLVLLLKPKHTRRLQPTSILDFPQAQPYPRVGGGIVSALARWPDRREG
jgi:hypothetical protein